MRALFSFVSLLFVVGTLVPAAAQASILSDIISFFTSNSVRVGTPYSGHNLQTMALLQPAVNIDPTAGRGGGDITIVDESALVPDEGPSGTIADITRPKNGTITRYVVQSGDTVSSVASMFDVTPGTVLAANDLKKGAVLHVGDVLIILPITGVPYTVQKGDTLASIAKKYGGDLAEIVAFNALESAAAISVGQELIIPNGEVPASATVRTTSSSGRSSGVFANNPKEPAHNVGAPGTAAEVGYYISPVSHYVRTQGIHGYNAVDLAAPVGTPVVASAAGTVVIAKQGGWNGGYGSYVVISHGNGSQTLYSHLSKVAAYDGENVVQGEVIGYVGNTGESTGPHVHFEIRSGIRNPF